MGTVYEVRVPESAERWALKLLDEATPELLERFRREARTLQLVGRHEGLVRLVDSGDERGFPFIVMDLLSGGSLEDRLSKGPFTEKDAASLVTTVARGVHFVHELGLVHRDLKPSNVLFDAAGRPRVTDFGLVKNRQEKSLTETGAVVGSAHYMAPEQVNAGPVDRRADVWALGVIFYELVTGSRAFPAPAPGTFKQILLDTPPRPTTKRAGLSRAVDAVCAKALAKAPEARYPTAEALAQDLDSLAAGAPVAAELAARARGQRKLVFALGALLVASVAAAAALEVRSRAIEGRLAASTAALEHERSVATELASALGHSAGAPADETLVRALASATGPRARAVALVEAALRVDRSAEDGLERAARLVEAAVAADELEVLVDLEAPTRRAAGAKLHDAAHAALEAALAGKAEASAVATAQRRLMLGRLLSTEDPWPDDGRALSVLWSRGPREITWAARPYIRDGGGRFTRTFDRLAEEGRPGATPIATTPELDAFLIGDFDLELGNWRTGVKRDACLELLVSRPEVGYLWRKTCEDADSSNAPVVSLRCGLEAVRIEPEDALALHWLGRALLANRRPREAVDYLEKSHRLVADDWRDLALVQAYVELGRGREALDQIAKLGEGARGGPVGVRLEAKAQELATGR
jgi:tetratricopeptide (TPR) repeat protein